MEDNMAFIKFIIGGLLILGSILFAFGLIFGGTFMMIANPDSFGAIVIWGIIDFVVFLTGIFLMRS